MNRALISPPNITVMLLAGITVSFLLTMFLWFWIDVEPVRSPYLSIEELPSAQIYETSDIETVLARPLFWLGREPVLTPEVFAVETDTGIASPLKNVKLLGIILTGEVHTALLEVDGKVISAQVGQVIQGWTVEKITVKEAFFAANKEQTSLSLVRERPASVQLKMIK